MAQERRNFIYGTENGDISGCIKNNVSEEIANKIFDEMIDFAKYAFNKSHAVCYSIISFQTAYLKFYYPKEFMAALITSVIDFNHKIVEYINECKSMGIKILPPDINESQSDFSVCGENIRFGLSAAKNIGRSISEKIIKEREQNGKYKSLFDFIERLSGDDLNKRNLETMIKCGMFDSLGGKRSQYIKVYQQILNGVSHNKKNKIDGQISMFDTFDILKADKQDIIYQI